MKIHDATENIEKQEKKYKITRSKYQDIESKYHPYDKLSEVINNEYKGFKGSTFTVRTSKELDTSLRVYSEANNIPIAESIKNILEKFFQEHTVARTFFRLEKPFTVAIPITLFEIEKYIEDGINCMIDMSSDIDSRLAVQRQLISNDETDYYLAVTYNVGNNYLDVYDEKHETYSAIDTKMIHFGLFDIYLEHLEQSVFIKVTFVKQKPIKAEIITKETALSMAENCNNKMLINYLDNIDQANDIIDFKDRLKERETYIKSLEARIKTLEKEIATLKDEVIENDAGAQDGEQNIEVKDDTKDEVNLGDPIQQVPSLLTPEQEKTLANTMAQIGLQSAKMQAQIKQVSDLLFNLEMQKRNITKDITETIMKHPAIKDDKDSEDAED